jgi:hypothetical protein
MTINRTDAFAQPLGFPLRFASRLSLQPPVGPFVAASITVSADRFAAVLGAAAPETPPALRPAPQPRVPRPLNRSCRPPSRCKQVAPEEAMPILGHSVVGPTARTVARLVDVLVDPNGKPVAAVLDFGGFMGVGTRKIAVHWGALQFEPAESTHRSR